MLERMKLGQKFRPVVQAALLAAVVALDTPAHAAWLDRPVTLVVPFAPGGITDILARMTAERLQSALKQSFVVENVSGAGGITATMRVARAPADGNTLYFATLSQIGIAPFTNKLEVDPVKAFSPISIIATSPFVTAIRNSFPATRSPISSPRRSPSPASSTLPRQASGH